MPVRSFGLSQRRIRRRSALAFLVLVGISFQAQVAAGQWILDGTRIYYNSGNVGIGTTNPSYPLHISGIPGQTSFYVGNGNFYLGNGSFDVQAPGDVTGRIQANGSNAGASIQVNSGNGVTSGRYAYLRLQSLETSAQEYRVGMYGSKDWGLYNWTVSTATPVLTVQAATNNVGIGTANPVSALHTVFPNGTMGSIIVDMGSVSKTGDGEGIDFRYGSTGILGGIHHYWTSSTGVWRLGFNAWSNSASVERLTINGMNGNVGVGTIEPQARLHVAGDIRADGNIAAKYQDFAEWVATDVGMDPGTVVITDPARVDHVLPSSAPYDTRVAGVVSAAPGIVLGEGGDGKLRVATLGRVKVKVDATKAPIEIGDLLVTGDLTGMAMKSQPMEIGGRTFHQPGTIIGKALEPLRSGTGEILVLLCLQ